MGGRLGAWKGVLWVCFVKISVAEVLRWNFDGAGKWV